ncbi:hypothetical protein VAR608DRAFT_1539 [Variovorax sp. HW608]|uniref:hypothetical protein n=1 Tax=Variovorax sp. HW608 TaxID=1034889 RepID=UPI0008200ACF|nr:hypothetical protein [Variovorax sp. HW608]SCK20689.1 hypothetical protein VAR608DRAFT_1539 [Variovorax sp. HW608]
MQAFHLPNGLRRWFVIAGVLALFSWSPLSRAQQRVERDGVAVYWGLVPEAIVSQQHAIEELHGGPPPGGGKINHLVLAVFDAKTGRRIDDAIIRAQLVEPGIVDQPPRYLPPMPVNGVGSYGQLFGMVYDGPYRFRVWVKLPERPAEIEFTIDAVSQLRNR